MKLRYPLHQPSLQHPDHLVRDHLYSADLLTLDDYNGDQDL